MSRRHDEAAVGAQRELAAGSHRTQRSVEGANADVLQTVQLRVGVCFANLLGHIGKIPAGILGPACDCLMLALRSSHSVSGLASLLTC